MQELKKAARRNGDPLELELFKFDGCPYCRIVQRRIQDLKLPVKMRDIRTEAGARDELINMGGKGQVPCLVINGKPLYESMDILAFLENEVVLAA